MPPNRLDRNIRRAIRASSTTLTMPAMAGAIRQPIAVSCQSQCWRWPSQDVPAISHLPSGGCTMNV